MEELKLTADARTLIEGITSEDGEIRLSAAQNAGKTGANALLILAEIAAGENLGSAKAARIAMETITHYAGRNGARLEANKVAKELLKIAQSGLPRMIRADAIQLLGYIANGTHVKEITKFAKSKELASDVVMTLQRIPGNASKTALKQIKS